MDRTKADGLRLDAVKHVRSDFFGATYGENKDSSDYGYLGQVQRQFNLTRGFTDDNHRDTLFDTEKPRDDAMAFGEHLGEPPGYGPYFDAGMRLVDNPLRNELNNRLGSPSNGLNGFDQSGAGGFAAGLTVMHAQSHDNDYASRRELQHAMYFTRAGLGLLYTDGNYQAETLGESGGAFPRHANTSFLGQWDDPRVPNLLYIHEQFARGYQQGKWSDDDVVVYEEAFLGFSYGFRPGKSQHDALDALSVAITGKRVNWILDADIEGFFDVIDHRWLIKFLEHRIGDRRVLRLIRKWLRAGVSEEGRWSEAKEGTPQGAVISPLLANVYLPLRLRSVD